MFVRTHVWELGLDVENREMNLRALVQQTCNLYKYFIYLPSFHEMILRAVPHSVFAMIISAKYNDHIVTNNQEL